MIFVAGILKCYFHLSVVIMCVRYNDVWGLKSRMWGLISVATLTEVSNDLYIGENIFSDYNLAI